MNKYAIKINEFQEYVLSFYNNVDGIYPIATKEFIIQHINFYLETLPLGHIHFDSLDRERIRFQMEEEMNAYEKQLA
tara:strand:- start:2199 stop:2429 length:231 start_codon:yes stop_codon:yes gene_type:complete